MTCQRCAQRERQDAHDAARFLRWFMAGFVALAAGFLLLGPQAVSVLCSAFTLVTTASGVLWLRRARLVTEAARTRTLELLAENTRLRQALEIARSLGLETH